MKVGAYVAGYSPDAGGGHTFEREILDALAGLAPGAHHRFTVLAPGTAAEAVAAHVRPAGIAVQPVVDGVFGRWVAGLERESALFRAHWRRPSAIDRAASAANVEFVWFLGAGVRQTDLPYLTVVWDLQHRATPWFPEMSARGLWEGRELAQRWFLQRATAVVTGTRVGQEELARYYEVPAERTLLLPHPTPRFALEAASRPMDSSVRTRFGLDGQFLIYPAQFWPHKNHVNLVRALAVLRDRDGLRFMLALVGSDKGNRAVVQAEIKRLGLGDVVRFLGFVERSDLVALYRQAFALVYASWCGPENLPPLEAFASGCPVVATRVPGAEEQLGEAALLVEPGDPTSIANGVKAIAADTGVREQLVAHGRARAERWTAEDYVRGVLGFLDRFEAVLRCWRPDQ